ncbi:hypothetical protein LZ31DRAFT_268208 [Colletotrichum somersetense]|nr:hypothetical protein LZ31DRAFT_268208 [Colletotrichum somersetense]
MVRWLYVQVCNATRGQRGDHETAWGGWKERKQKKKKRSRRIDRGRERDGKWPNKSRGWNRVINHLSSSARPTSSSVGKPPMLHPSSSMYSTVSTRHGGQRVGKREGERERSRHLVMGVQLRDFPGCFRERKA